MSKAAEIILVLTIIGSSLAFGGVQPPAYSAMAGGVLVALLLLLVRQTLRGEIRLKFPIWPVLFVVWVLISVIPLPAGLVERIAPLRLLDPALARLISIDQSWAALSTYSYGTLIELSKFLAYLGGFIAAGYLFDSRKGKSLLLRGLIALGCFQAGYGLYQHMSGSPNIFTYVKQFAVGEATGTYINRNHFAGLLELTFPFAVASAYFAFLRWWGNSIPGVARRVLRGGPAALYQGLFYVFIALMMVLAVVLSKSRMGILSTVFTLVVLALLAQLRTRKKMWAFGLVFVLIGVTGYGLWIGLDPVLARFEQFGDGSLLDMDARSSLWRDTIVLIQESPWVGWGLGSYATVFRHHQTTLVDKLNTHAHNEYLHYTSEVGLVGAVLLFLPIFYLLVRMVVSFLNDDRRYRQAVALGCIGSTLAILLHSLTDFNLAIPANALIFAVILGIGYKVTVLERLEERRAAHGPELLQEKETTVKSA